MALPIHVAAVQYSSEKLNRVGNQDKVFHLMDDAAHIADLVVLPEASFTCGWMGAQAHEVAEPLYGSTCAVTLQIAVTRNSHICYNIAELDGDRIYNTAVLIGAGGSVIGKQRKVRLSEADVDAGFSPGDSVTVFETHLGRIGILVSQDAEDIESVRALHRGGAQLIIVPCVAFAALPEAREGVARSWETVLGSVAKNGRCHALWADKIGGEGDLIAVGSSMVLDPEGNIVVRGSADQEEIVRAGITLGAGGSPAI